MAEEGDGSTTESDGSTTESDEFFDDELDDDHLVMPGGADALGGVSAQSSSRVTGGGNASHVAATAGVGVVPVKRVDAPGALVATPRSAPAFTHTAPRVASSTLSVGARATASSSCPDAIAVKHESRVTMMHHPVPPSPVSLAYNGSNNSSQLGPSPPMIQSSAASTWTLAHASASSAPWPPLPSATHVSSFAVSRGPPPSSDYRAPAAFQASRLGGYTSSYRGGAVFVGAYPASNGGTAPFQQYAPVVNGAPGPPAYPVYGYHPPLRVDYAPPRSIQTQYQYQSPPVSEAAASIIRTSSKPATSASSCSAAAPASSTYSAPSLAGATVQTCGRAPTQCRHCFAKLNVPLLKVGRDCRCCSLLYPFSQFPMQNNQDKSPHRRCHACYTAWGRKNTEVKSTHSAVLRSQRSTAHVSLPPVPAHATNANVNAPRFAPILPPPRIPLSPAMQQHQQSVASRPTRVGAAQSPISVAPIPGSAPAPPAAAAPGRRCASCKLVMYSMHPSSIAGENLKCLCCLKLLLKSTCFSNSQRKEGKHRCKACLGQVNLDFSGETVPVTPASERSKITQTVHKLVLRSRVVALSAERQVAKYHLARRSLQRKREANDLRGSTCGAYVRQLVREEVELKALEAQLRAKFPHLFDKQVGVQVVAPLIPRGGRDRLNKSKKVGKPSERSELRAKKKREQEAATRLTSTAVAVINSTIRRSAPEVFDLTGGPSPGTIARANLTVRLPKTKTAATLAKTRTTKPAAPAPSTIPVAKLKAAAKPTTTTTVMKKRKEIVESAWTPVVAKEKPLKKPKTSKTSTAPTADDDYDADPWLAAHDEIAQGLSQLLSGSLDDILGAAVSGSSSRSGAKKERKPPPPPLASALPLKKAEREARPEPFTYAPKTKLQAEAPPQTTIATRTRKRTLQSPPEIIDMADSPRAADPNARKKKMRFFI